jgi:hypothetical protein
MTTKECDLLLHVLFDPKKSDLKNPWYTSPVVWSITKSSTPRNFLGVFGSEPHARQGERRHLLLHKVHYRVGSKEGPQNGLLLSPKQLMMQLDVYKVFF